MKWRTSYYNAIEADIEKATRRKTCWKRMLRYMLKSNDKTKKNKADTDYLKILGLVHYLVLEKDNEMDLTAVKAQELNVRTF